MARYKSATWRPLPENKTQPLRRRSWKLFILHSQVGHYDLYDYFGKTSVVLESTFQVPLDGKADQFLDTDRTADANYRANPGAISAETADDGDPDTDPWNPAQCETLAQLLAEASIVDGVPLRPAKSWDDDGVGYHSQFDEWTVAEGIGKTCPGKIRIKQIPGIIARAKEIVEGDEMTEGQIEYFKQKLLDIEAAVAKVDERTWGTVVPGATNVSGQPQTALAVVGQTWKRSGTTVAVELNEADRAQLRAELLADIVPLIPTAAQIATAVNDDAARRLAK